MTGSPFTIWLYHTIVCKHTCAYTNIHTSPRGFFIWFSLLMDIQVTPNSWLLGRMSWDLLELQILDSATRLTELGNWEWVLMYFINSPGDSNTHLSLRPYEPWSRNNYTQPLSSSPTGSPCASPHKALSYLLQNGCSAVAFNTAWLLCLFLCLALPRCKEPWTRNCVLRSPTLLCLLQCLS